MRTRVLILCLATLAACGGEQGDSANDAAERPAGRSEPAADAASPATINGNVSGEAAYEQYCIGCHETGLFDAPVVGTAAEWEHVSKLWQAVVVEHAEQGYFDMPAKGGRAELPDDVVQAAVEHMLTITYPDLPKDMR